MKKYLFLTLLMAATSPSVWCMETNKIEAEFTVNNTVYTAIESNGSITIDPSIQTIPIADRVKIIQQARKAIEARKEELAEAKQRPTVGQYSDRLQSLYNYFSSLLLPSTGKTFGSVEEKKDAPAEAQEAYAYQPSPVQATTEATFTYGNVEYSAKKTDSGSIMIETLKDRKSPDRSLISTLIPLAKKAIENQAEGPKSTQKGKAYEQTSYLQRIGLYLKKKTQDAYNYYWQKQ